jgi:hypothetical protein
LERKKEEEEEYVWENHKKENGYFDFSKSPLTCVNERNNGYS